MVTLKRIRPPYSLTMDDLRFLSLNCHGLSVDIICYLRSVAQNYDFILLQETWMSQFNSNRLNEISDDFVFFHSSAMEDRLQSGILTGRPFGGTAVLVRSTFANRVSVITTLNPRVTAVRLSNPSHSNMLICSVYMPWNDRSLRQLEEYEATIGCLQAIVNGYVGCSVVLGGDWNVAKDGNYPAEPFVSQFCWDNNLCWLDQSDDSVDFTYHCDANNHFSLVDHFICSS